MNAILQFLNTWGYLIKIVTVVIIFICSIILIVKDVKWLIDVVVIIRDATFERGFARLSLQNFQNMKNTNNLNSKDFNEHLDLIGKNFEDSLEISNSIIETSKQFGRKICIKLAIFSIVAISCGAGLISFFLTGN